MEPGLEETLRIHALYARYARAIDSGDGEAWAACYAEDGEYWSSTFGTCRGRGALAEFCRAHHARWQAQGIQTRHWNNQVLLERTAEGIAGSVYVMLLGVRAGERPQIFLQTVYDDRLVETGGIWRLQRRASHADTTPDPAQLGFERWPER